MSLKYAAIPTMYKGIQMRSRLEAKWAAMFDLLGWTWEYEPLDLNGWIPDFAITNIANVSPTMGQKIKPVLAEVKPIFQLDWSITDKIERSIAAPVNENHECDTPQWKAFFETSQYDYMLFGAGFNPGWPTLGWYMQSLFGWFPLFIRMSDLELKLLWDHCTNKLQWKSPTL